MAYEFLKAPMPTNINRSPLPSFLQCKKPDVLSIFILFVSFQLLVSSDRMHPALSQVVLENTLENCGTRGIIFLDPQEDTLDLIFLFY